MKFGSSLVMISMPLYVVGMNGNMVISGI